VARTSGSEAILDAVAHWRDRCLLANGSVFTGEPLWSLEHLAELNEHFVRSIDESDRKFLEKLHDQVAGTSPNAIKLMAELLWVMLLFPNNITRGKKVEIVTTVWGWSGDRLPNNHDYLVPFEVGIGSAGMGYNSYRYLELAFLIRAIEAWKAVPSAEQFRLVNDPWAFAEFLDGVDGADKRQLRHMLPTCFSRILSSAFRQEATRALSMQLSRLTSTVMSLVPTRRAPRYSLVIAGFSESGISFRPPIPALRLISMSAIWREDGILMERPHLLCLPLRGHGRLCRAMPSISFPKGWMPTQMTRNGH